MKYRILLIALVMLLVLVIGSFSVMAQEPEPTPAWAQELLTRMAHVEAQNDQILAALNGGVVLAPVQGPVDFGPVTITGGGDHNGALKIINTTNGGYGVWIRGAAVGLLAEAPIAGSRGVGAWFNGDGIGLLAEGNLFNGLQAMGTDGYGISASGGAGATYPAWGGAAQCTVDVAAVADAVWDEDVTGHTAYCSATAVLSGKRCRTYVPMAAAQ